MSAPTFRVYTDELEWLRAREFSIGSSAAPVILGVAKYATPFSLWAQMTGKAPGVEDSVRLEVGRVLEPMVHRRVCAKHPELSIDRPDGRLMVKSDAMPYAHATPDALLRAESGEAYGVVEYKTVEAYTSSDWGAEPSPTAAIQVQHSLAVTGLESALVGAMIGFSALKTFEVERNPDLIDLLQDREYAFRTCVDQDIPPAVDGSAVTKKALKLCYPVDTGGAVRLRGARWADWFVRWERAVADMKAAEEEKNIRENELRLALGADSVALITDGQDLPVGAFSNRRSFYKASVHKEHFRRNLNRVGYEGAIKRLQSETED